MSFNLKLFIFPGCAQDAPIVICVRALAVVASYFRGGHLAFLKLDLFQLIDRRLVGNKGKEIVPFPGAHHLFDGLVRLQLHN